MKKVIYLILAFTMVLSIFTACGKKDEQLSSSALATENKDKIKIIATVFPVYDWIREITGDSDKVELTLLLDNGVDMHSYQPSADDILAISNCDLFVYVGGESDKWLDNTLKQIANKNMKSINLMEVLGENIKEEKIIEGMESYHNHSHEHDDLEYDEHIWLSVKNAKICCKEIAETINEIDKDNYNNNYSKNFENYINKLSDLDEKYTKTISESDKNTLLFGDRFPFLYLLDEYGLNYYAAFTGCSAETEASFNTITFLANKIDELGLKVVLTLEKSDKKIAETIIKNTNDKNQKILELDSMQSTTSKDCKNGVTYLSIMENNLKVIEESLK